ncbi:hypothetical protein amrb99_51670 [Actinomadura sp. RB99]|uniref:hypothetical protein n=1 Tax=Actinomadura sp. RB99 TaxID=2691577 RepID=UPI001688C312|nr:hypothetical protein [Actinomadura sp. RB99]MBD2896223.1 hypothetical protein [Actinomadura sp. RB99]
MGAHAWTSEAPYIPSPPEPTRANGPGTLIPQRERITCLVHLSKAFAHIEGIVTAFAVIQGYAVLNVIPLGWPGRSVTVGCRYCRDGAWWLYDIRTGQSIRPANEARLAAHRITTQIEEAAAA